MIERDKKYKMAIFGKYDEIDTLPTDLVVQSAIKTVSDKLVKYITFLSDNPLRDRSIIIIPKMLGTDLAKKPKKDLRKILGLKKPNIYGTGIEQDVAIITSLQNIVEEIELK